MHPSSSVGYRRLFLQTSTIVAFGAALALPVPAAAQQQNDPPPWAQGRKAAQANSPLAPNEAKLLAAAPKDIAVDKLKLPAGFEATLWASGMANARSLAIGPKGTVFVGSRLVGKVYAVVDKGDKREVITIAQGLHRPNGVALKDGNLYVAELSRIIRYDDIENHLDKPPEPKVVYDQLPKDEPHGWKFIAFGPDGNLYIPIGAPCNICLPPDTHAQIRRIKADGTGMEVVALGVRNSVGFDWHPVTKNMWFTDNGRDWIDDNLPNDELNQVTKVGQHFGHPFCLQGDLLDEEFGQGKKCADYEPPMLKLGPHVAALGMRFYTGDMFPAEYKNAMLIAQHGSWNRTEKIGYRVMRVTLDANGKVAKYEPFIEGFLDGQKILGRPVDVQQMKDGSLLVSDDWNGAIYRVAYKK
jgi:glucose/arabinose dehydrogenase